MVCQGGYDPRRLSRPSAPRLTRRLNELGTDPEPVLTHLDAALLARITARSGTDLTRHEPVRVAAESLSAAGRRPEHLPALAHRFAVSERHLRGLFADGVGLSPKRFERIARVRRVLAHGHGSTRAGGCAQIAAANGYYDQSHMTTEFRTMMGVPPAAFFAGRLPDLQPC